MMRCTEPERWVSAPGAAAAEEEVARYLAHIDECPFHAALEQRETARVRGVAALAGSAPAGLGSDLRKYVGSDAGQDKRGKIRRKLFIDTLSIRVNGKERGRIDLAAQRRVALEVEAGALIAVWQPSRADGSEEVYLTSYLPVGGRMTDRKEISATVLEGGHRISFAAKASADARMQITVTYTTTNWWRALCMFLGQRTHILAAGARTWGWSPVARTAVAVCALLASLLFVFVFFLRTEKPVPIANPEQPQQPRIEHAPPFKEPSLSATTGAENRNLSIAPLPTPARDEPRGARDIPAPSRTHVQLTVATVRRIYVSPGESAYDRQLRAALIEQLRAGAKFTVVSREQQAEAVLMREQSRGTDLSVQLLSRAGKSLWFTTQPTDAESSRDVSNVAARIVTALTAAADKRRPSVNTPQP
jgi:hypothetical protein